MTDKLTCSRLPACVALLLSIASVGCSGDEAARPDAGGSGGLPASDGAAAGDGNVGWNGGGDGNIPGGGHGNTDGDACAHADVRVTRQPPTVWLLVDRTLANTAYGDSSGGITSIYTDMWKDMMDPDGTVTLLQDTVRFGLMLTGVNQIVKPLCPGLETVEPALNNRAAIAARYPDAVNPGGLSLQYYSLHALLERAKAEPDPAVLNSTAAVVFIPQAGEKFCIDETLQWGDSDGAAVQQNNRLVKELAELGVRTFVVGSAVECNCFQTDMNRLNQLAMLGGSGHGPFLVGQRGELTAALAEITSSLIDCQVALHGEVEEGAECTGEVQVDGVTMPCNDENGWKLRGRSSIEFVGEACTKLKQRPQARITARFPCDVVVVF